MVTHPRRGSRGSSVTNTGMVNTVARYITGSSAKPAPERLPPATRVCLSLSLSLSQPLLFLLFSLLSLSPLSPLHRHPLLSLSPPSPPNTVIMFKRYVFYLFNIFISFCFALFLFTANPFVPVVSPGPSGGLLLLVRPPPSLAPLSSLSELMAFLL